MCCASFSVSDGGGVEAQQLFNTGESTNDKLAEDEDAE